jgi:CHAT domain-containing protein
MWVRRRSIATYWAAILLQLSWSVFAPGLQQPSATTSIDQRSSEVGDDADAALKRALHLADLYNWADAEPFFSQAEKLYSDRGDTRNALYAHFGRIRSTMEQRALPEVSEQLRTQLLSNPLLESDKELRLFCLIVKGDVDGEIDAVPARRDWEEALTLATDLGDAKWKNRASAEIGFALFLEGDVTAAQQKVASALIAASVQHDVGAQIRYITAIGTAFVLMDSYDEGMNYLDKALKVARANPDAGYPFVIEESRLAALKGLGKLDDAERLANEIVTQAKERNKLVKETQALITISRIANAKHDDGKEISALESAIQLADKGGFKRLLTDAQFHLVDVYRRQGRTAEAEQLASAAAETTQSIGDIYLVPERLAVLAELEASQQQYAQADETYDRASDILDMMVGNVTAAYAKANLITGMSDIYGKHFALLVDHLRNPGKAYTVLERARGRVTADLLLSGTRPDTRQEEDVEHEIGRLNLDLSRAKSAGAVRRIRDQIFLAEQARLVGPGPNAWRSRPIDPIALDTVKRALGTNEAILEYVLADPHSYCLVITRDSFHVVALPSQQVIEPLLTDFSKKIKAKQEVASEAEKLYDALLAPIPESRRTHWVIVCDGRLHLLPFDALRDGKGHYLISSHVISYAPSATSLYLMNLKSARKPPVRSLLAVGGVPYDQRQDTTQSAAKAGYVREGLGELPGSKREVLLANDAVGGHLSKLLLGSAATESAFKNAHLDDFEIIHLAVHGVADEKHPDRAALILLSDSASGEDGILQPHEIMQLHINSSLVVLSACNTAVGRLQGQEGIANLSRAFLLAGARNVVSTLWSTDDLFSALLMQRFYAQLANGSTVAYALTKAKRELLESYGDEALPYYWAGFTLEGSGNATIRPGNLMGPRHVTTRQITHIADNARQSQNSR